MEEFTKEYVEMWKRWSDFNGRSNVREYWMPVLVNFIVGLILAGLGRVFNIFNTVDYLYGIAILVPFLALAIRRMHDIGKTGFSLLWVFLPIIGWIYLIYLLIQPSI